MAALGRGGAQGVLVEQPQGDRDASRKDRFLTMAARTLNVVTYNIHKGLSQFNRRLVLHEIREQLNLLGSDVAFLQEVQGKHEKNSRRHVNWPDVSQHEFLSHEGAHCVYGMNCVYTDGHHGNAVVSRHPIPVWEN